MRPVTRPSLTSSTTSPQAWKPVPGPLHRNWPNVGAPLAASAGNIREPRQPTPRPSIHSRAACGPRSQIAYGGMDITTSWWRSLVSAFRSYRSNAST